MNPTLAAAIVAFANAVLGLVTNFGVDLTDTQKGSITTLVNAGLVLIGLVWAVAHKRGVNTTTPGQ